MPLALHNPSPHIWLRRSANWRRPVLAPLAASQQAHSDGGVEQKPRPNRPNIGTAAG